MQIKTISVALAVLTCLLFSSLSNASANNSSDEYFSEKVLSGLEVPWGMAFLSENELLITEKSGRLSRFTLDAPKELQMTEITGLPEIMNVGQGGLLDVKIEPRSLLTKQPTVYFTYVAKSTLTDDKNLPTLNLARANLAGTQLENWQVLFEANKPQTGGHHFGSRIVFDEQGYVFFSMGDRGERDNAQDLSSHAGSIFRLHLDGSIPDDNPFVGEADKMPEIWSYGHRNPQGLAFNSQSKQLWSIEHGPRGGDEINLIGKGKNYGWPVISYGREYISNFKVSQYSHKEGMEQPVHYFTPSIAPSSLMIYSGKKFPKLKHRLFSGALKLRHLNVVILKQDSSFKEEKRLLEKLSERIRNVAESPTGDIYFATDSGDIFKLINTK